MKTRMNRLLMDVGFEPYGTAFEYATGDCVVEVRGREVTAWSGDVEMARRASSEPEAVELAVLVAAAHEPLDTAVRMVGRLDGTGPLAGVFFNGPEGCTFRLSSDWNERFEILTEYLVLERVFEATY
jgi:hypothetical protein